MTHAIVAKCCRAMIQKHSVNSTLMVTWANAHYLDFVLNWASHVEAANISTYLVGALDDELLEALVSRGVPTFAMHTGLSASRDLGWGSPDFFLMVLLCPAPSSISACYLMQRCQRGLIVVRQLTECCRPMQACGNAFLTWCNLGAD